MHIQSFQFNFRMEEERWVTSMSLSAALLHFAFFSKSFFYKKATKAVTLTVPGSALLLDEECGDADHLQLTMWMHSLLTESSKKRTLLSLLHSLLLQNLSPQTSIRFYAFGSFIQTQFCSSGKTTYLEILSLHSFLSYLPLLVGCCILFYSHLLKSLGLVPFLAAQRSSCFSLYCSTLLNSSPPSLFRTSFLAFTPSAFQ